MSSSSGLTTLSRFKLVVHQQKLKFANTTPLKRVAVIFTLIFAFIVFYKLTVYIFITDLSYHTENVKCPACFGTRMCKRIHETSVHGKEKFHHINYLTNVKNVFYGELNGMEFVYKKLAHGAELEKIDSLICQGGITECRPSYNNHLLCVPAEHMGSKDRKSKCLFSESVNEIINGLQGPMTPQLLTGFNDALQCPTQRLIQHMVDRYQERGVFRHANGLDSSEMFMFLYTHAVNPEPIILQSFPAGEGWPFPHYIGACGRMVATEYAGKPLRAYFNSDWTTRVKLSLEVLKIADHLTDNIHGFKLYFSDVNLDNYVVSDDLKVIIADAENIVIVDEQHIAKEKPAGYDTVYVSSYDDCPTGTNCLSIDVNRLCSHRQSDFNFYAVCRSLLSSYAEDEKGDTGGLLHSPPSNRTAAKIVKLANECARPTAGVSRLLIKEQLMDELELTLKPGKHK